MSSREHPKHDQAEALEDAVRHVEARSGHTVDEELFARLLDRLGMTDVGLALERLQEARQDV
jgi:CubicO group peptidase (beta-lactamase class C family)